MNWLPILLLAVGGFLVGGTLSLWKTNRSAAVLCGAFAAGCVIGGVVWLL